MTSVLVGIYLFLLAGAQLAIALGYVVAHKWSPLWGIPMAFIMLAGLVGGALILYRVGWFA